MAITNIRNFRNDTSVDLYLLNLENPGDTGGSAIEIAAHGGMYTHDMWIPWCNRGHQGLFPQHHIAIWDGPDRGTPIFCIWQNFGIDSNQVLFSTTGQWVASGETVTGDSGVGGDRSLVVGQAPDGRYILNIRTYTEPSGSSSPSPAPFSMVYDGSTNRYEADISDGQLAPIDFRINGVRNVTHGPGSDPSTVTMTLSHRDFSGPIDIPPRATSHAFDGQPLTGHWHALLSGADIDTRDSRALVEFYLV